MRAVLFFLITIFFLAESAQKIKDLVVEFHRNNKQATFGKEFKYYSLLIESKLSDDYDDFVDEFNKAAQKYEEKVKFMFMNTDIEDNWQAIEYLGIIAEDVPTVLFIILDKGLTKFKMPYDEITKGNIEQFIDDCFEGKAVSFAKSEDIPENWNAKPVKRLVGKNFEKNVFVKGKTSFVFFYAPWCTACQNTMPEVEKLGLMYNSDKRVMIAKVDSTVNEIPKMPVFDVPMLALFVDGEKKPLYYTDNDRTAAAFSAFIQKHIPDDEQKTPEDKEQHILSTKDNEDEAEPNKGKQKDEPAKKKEEVDQKKKTKAKKEEKEGIKGKKEKGNEKRKEEKEVKGKRTAEKASKKPKENKADKKEASSSAKKDETAKKTKATSEKSKKKVGKKTDAKESSKKKPKTAKKEKTEL